jgi:hypothetical protein
MSKIREMEENKIKNFFLIVNEKIEENEVRKILSIKNSLNQNILIQSTKFYGFVPKFEIIFNQFEKYFTKEEIQEFLKEFDKYGDTFLHHFVSMPINDLEIKRIFSIIRKIFVYESEFKKLFLITNFDKESVLKISSPKCSTIIKNILRN